MKKKALFAAVLAIAVLSLSKKNREKIISVAKNLVPDSMSNLTERFMPSR